MLVEEIKELRVEIDGLARTAAIMTYDGKHLSWEMKDCMDSLKLSKAWLGKMLGATGVKSPYNNDGHRHTVKDIEETAESSVPTDFFRQTNETKPLGAAVEQLNYIERVDALREMIKKTLVKVTDIVGNPELPSFYGEMTLKYLMEARFHLGFDLQRIKESEDE